MANLLKNIFWLFFAKIDAILKFPNLKKNEIGIQLGFDMSAYLASDLFTMYQRVIPKGLVIGIDPDPNNHKIAKKIINQKKFNIQLIQKGTFSKQETATFLIGEKSSWNQLNNIETDTSVSFSNKKIQIELDTLDNIVDSLKLNIQKISHINLTINGAEYDTLLGMNKILKESKNLSLTIIAGRHDESGIINGKQDLDLILPILHSYGFITKFKRINELFWWGFVVKTLINRKWIYHQPNYGVIMAYKGNKKTKWYQSFS